MGGLEHIEFPSQVTVTGSGKEATRISSSVPQGIDGAAPFTLNDGTVVQDCWLEGTLYNGYYQTLVGMAAIPDQDITTYLMRVKITGDSDGIFIWTNQLHTYRLYAYDCDISTKYDAVAVLGSSFNPQYVELWNCTLTVQQPDPIPAHVSNCVNVRTGVVRLFNCTLNATGDENSVQTDGIYAWNLGTAEVYDCTFNVSSPAGQAFDFIIQDDAQVIVGGGQGSGAGGSYTSDAGREVYTTAPDSSVVGRQVFYNNSRFDNQDSAANVADAGAIAPDKTALLAGETATAANYTSYARGINGIIVDLAGPHGAITAADFLFRTGTSSDLDEWTEAPAPLSVVVLGGEGEGHSDRIEITWADNVIQNEWLQVIVKGNDSLGGNDTNTGLAASDVFFFGNRIGDTFAEAPPTVMTTNAADEIAARTNPGYSQPIESVYDFNRDGLVNAADQIIARTNVGFLTRIIDWPSPSAPAEADVMTDGSGSAVASALAAQPGTARRSVPAPPPLAISTRSAEGQIRPTAAATLRSIDARSMQLPLPGKMIRPIDADQVFATELFDGGAPIDGLLFDVSCGRVPR